MIERRFMIILQSCLWVFLFSTVQLLIVGNRPSGYPQPATLIAIPDRSRCGLYMVLTLTLPAPLWSVISILLSALSKSDDWYVSLSVLLYRGSTIALPNPVVA